MAEFSKGDTVRVVKVPFGASVEGRKPQVGETATIRHVRRGVGILYATERVGSNGMREWLCEFAPGDVERVEH
jgi:hypothetical protein